MSDLEDAVALVIQQGVPTGHAGTCVELVQELLLELREARRFQRDNDEILDIFHDMSDAIRGNRQMKPNPRTERFIDKKLSELCGVLGRKR